MTTHQSPTTCPTCGSAVRVVGSEQDKAREFPPRRFALSKELLWATAISYIERRHESDVEYLPKIEHEALRAQDRAEVGGLKSEARLHTTIVEQLQRAQKTP